MPERAVIPTLEEAPYTIPPFATSCMKAAGDAWAASFDHPFVVALAEGTLDTERFTFYQMQDARYLEAFSDASAIISARCPDPVDKLWFIDAARLALVVEGELHVGYGEKLGYTPEDIATLELTPNNRAYRNHIISTAHTGALVEAVAALAPCPWLYIELGRYLLERLGGEIPDDHPYVNWLRMYSDPDFFDYMDNLLARLERYTHMADVDTLDRAREAFVMSTRYEWMFWEQAWTRQPWPV